MTTRKAILYWFTLLLVALIYVGAVRWMKAHSLPVVVVSHDVCKSYKPQDRGKPCE